MSVSEKPLQEFRLCRRLNLGNYEHYELETIIWDEDETRAMQRAIDLFEQVVAILGARERVAITRIPKRDYSDLWQQRVEQIKS